MFTQDLKAHGAEMEVYADEFGDGAPIVGFIKNVNITSMRKADSPVAFHHFGIVGHLERHFYLRFLGTHGCQVESGQPIYLVAEEGCQRYDLCEMSRV